MRAFSVKLSRKCPVPNTLEPNALSARSQVLLLCYLMYLLLAHPARRLNVPQIKIPILKPMVLMIGTTVTLPMKYKQQLY